MWIECVGWFIGVVTSGSLSMSPRSVVFGHMPLAASIASSSTIATVTNAASIRL